MGPDYGSHLQVAKLSCLSSCPSAHVSPTRHASVLSLFFFSKKKQSSHVFISQSSEIAYVVALGVELS